MVKFTPESHPDFDGLKQAQKVRARVVLLSPLLSGYGRAGDVFE
jgi:hypothetical protein